MNALNRVAWSLLDPIVWKFRSRLLHLEGLRNSGNCNKLWENCATFDSSVLIHADAVLENYGRRENFRLGAYTHIRGQLSIVAPDGRLALGHHSFVGPGSRIWAQTDIRIGNHVLISHLVDIHDNDAHSLDADLRRRIKKDPVINHETPQSGALLEKLWDMD